MIGSSFLADTNIFIYLLNKESIIEQFLESEWYYSFITRIELLSKQGITEKEIETVNGVLTACTYLAHSEPIDELTINLKRKYKIKLPDAIIAATALHLQLPLLTVDKGFTKVNEIDVVLLYL